MFWKILLLFISLAAVSWASYVFLHTWVLTGGGAFIFALAVIRILDPKNAADGGRRMTIKDFARTYGLIFIVVAIIGLGIALVSLSNPI